MLYVIRALGTDLYKVGYSAASPEKRLNELQTGCPYELKLEFVCEGEREDEANLHNWMDRLGWRVRSEWFEIKPYDFYKLLIEKALSKNVKYQPVSVLSNASAEARGDKHILQTFIERQFVVEKTGSFNTMLGISFDDFWHEYSMYCKRYSQPKMDAPHVIRFLYDMNIGHKIDNQGVYIFNMRRK